MASVGAEGIEPPSAVCRTTALPLDEAPVGAAGVEPAPSCSRNRRLPIKPSRREIDSGRTTHPWFDAGRCVGVEVVPAPAAFRVSLQPGDESLRARAADRHVGSVIVPRRRVERATATETAFGIFHGVLLSSFREPPGNRTPFARVRAGCFASKAWDSWCRLRAAGWSRTNSGRLKRPEPRPFGRRRRNFARVRVVRRAFAARTRASCTAQESNLASQRRGVYSAPCVPALGAYSVSKSAGPPARRRTSGPLSSSHTAITDPA